MVLAAKSQHYISVFKNACHTLVMSIKHRKYSIRVRYVLDQLKQKLVITHGLKQDKNYHKLYLIITALVTMMDCYLITFINSIACNTVMK